MQDKKSFREEWLLFVYCISIGKEETSRQYMTGSSERVNYNKGQNSKRGAGKTMILVLTADPSLQNPWQRFWKRPSFREVSAMGESIMLVNPGSKPQWDKLSQKVGRYAGRVVAAQDIDLPKERPWKRQDNSKMKERILGNTLCSFSDSLDWVGLYDPEGKRNVLAWELAQCYPRVTVWCRFRERYQALCGDLMEQLGASIELTQCWDGLMGCPLIGAMEMPDFRLRWDGTMLLTARADFPPISGTLRHDLQIPIPEELLSICPGDVDPMELFLAVLKEKRQEIPTDLCYQVLEVPALIGQIEKFL